MYSKIKESVNRSLLGSILVFLFRLLVKQPYWLLRRNIFKRPLTQTIGGVTAQFTVDHESDVRYHEFESERRIIRDVLDEVKDGDVFYDIGGNIGLYSCFVANAEQNVSIVVVEPSPPPYEKLERNLALNDTDAHLFQNVATDSNRSVEFAVDTNDIQSRQSKIAGSESMPGYNVVERSGIMLDTLQKQENLPKPTVVKIDVEGAEMKVLHGMEQLLDSVEVLYCEIHHSMLANGNVSGEDVRNLLLTYGFELEVLDEREGGNEFVKAINSDRS